MAPIRFDETDDLIDICLDNVFKTVFTRNTPASRGGNSPDDRAYPGRNCRVVEGWK
jgi:hypothetical protein